MGIIKRLIVMQLIIKIFGQFGVHNLLYEILIIQTKINYLHVLIYFVYSIYVRNDKQKSNILIHILSTILKNIMIL
jgi:hypothetical protein